MMKDDIGMILSVLMRFLVPPPCSSFSLVVFVSEGGKAKILDLLILQQICNAVLTIKVSWGDIFP
jgi:hypothetical protein